MQLAEVGALDVAPAMHNAPAFLIKVFDDVVSPVTVCGVMRDLLGKSGAYGLRLVLLAAAIEEYFDGRPDEDRADLQSARPYRR